MPPECLAPEYVGSLFDVPIPMSVGDWVPDRPDHLNDWIQEMLKDIDKDGCPITHPAVLEFKNDIESDPELFMGFHRIFENVPERDPLGRLQVKDYLTMLSLFQRFMGDAPSWNPRFLVFLPFTTVLQWPMSMSNGFTILINRRVNDHFRKIFAVWLKFLASSQSNYVLHEGCDGWLSPEAMENMPKFKETFVCDPGEPHWGFTSWNHFFARELRPGARPPSNPDDDRIITSACESKFLRKAFSVTTRDQFWMKNQPYSLVHMLNNDPLASSFVGGTVYQAFLSPYYYHRWHSPVEGTVVKTQGQQPFLSHVATRALIFIQARNPNIGLMCFIGVGMVEVSTCDITVEPGQVVKKGQEIGTLHFGGSTHCLVFGPQVKLEFLNSTNEVIPAQLLDCPIDRVEAHL
ncbi:hypothetical protein BOTBODRAFT_638719 [Botryobasidium botryosum FD-172 SS1]|uniref:L-tryptophan decarboxylase PsiD-like domain-containing protein n=1 Tax=Botryobasidium botryosum (strain FD-172 SS1) TaxID=930990 RepID=A0A067M514_BOTB1|nr:hypothetical protein BOTBODRAFT_638719 [Botryobasidium botryosum FD-172 SS1]